MPGRIVIDDAFVDLARDNMSSSVMSPQTLARMNQFISDSSERGNSRGATVQGEVQTVPSSTSGIMNTLMNGFNNMVQDTRQAGLKSAAQNTINSMIPNAASGSTVVDDTTVTEGTDGQDTWLDENTVEYTYKEGDTFGQVIKDLGLMTDNGLWGNNGDVKYYEKQLRDQGWSGGNIPVGTKIRLRKRPAVQYDIYGNRIRQY